MSKGSLFWANARGKLGESVYYRAGGEQRNRTYVARIKNPRTRAQAIVRASMGNLVSMYRTAKVILANTFPDKKTNQSAFNAFVQANKNSNSAVVGKAGVANNMCIPQGIYISKGNEPVLGQSSALTMGEEDMLFFGWDLGEEGQPKNDWLKNLLSGSSEMSFSGGIPEEVFANLGLPTTAKFALLHYSYADEGYEFGAVVYDKDGQTMYGIGSDQFHELGITKIESDIDATRYFLGVASGEEKSKESNDAWAVLLAYRDGNGKMQVTTSQVHNGTTNRDPYADWLPDGFVYEQVIAQYTGSQPAI